MTSFTKHDLDGVALAADGKTGIVVGDSAILEDGGIVFTTDDSGETWEKLDIDIKEVHHDLQEVAIAANGKTGIAVGGSGTVLNLTKDNAEKWKLTKVEIGTKDRLFDVALSSDGQTGVAVGSNGSVFKTKDSGKNWGKVKSGVNIPLYGVALAANGKTGIVVGHRGTMLIIKENNNGWNTEEVASGIENSLYGVALAADNKTGIAVGANGTILITKNSDESWTYYRETLETELNDLLNRRRALVRENDQLKRGIDK